MNTEQMRAFVAVAQQGSFTAAAKDMFMAQSTATRRVALLEGEIGVQLLYRVPQVRLTRAGEAFLPEARRILQAVEQAEEIARDAQGRP